MSRFRLRPPAAPWRHHGPVVSLVAGEGPPVLLLHGLAASSRWWTRNVSALAEHYRVRAVDLPAFGASGHGAPFDLEHIPEQLVALMDDLGIGRASIVGHSMGGLIAARLAADFPDRVDRLVLVDAGFLTFDPSWLHKVTGPIRALRFARPGLVRTLAGDVLRVGPVRLIQATWQLVNVDWTDCLPRITAPTLVIWGEHDTICPPVIGRTIVERLPGARMVTIAGCGHNPMWEHADEFDQAVLAFLAESH